MKEKVIVTGSNGQLGKCLVSMLIDDGYEVLGVDIKHDENCQEINGYTRHTLDIKNEISVENFFSTLTEKESIVGLVNNAATAVFTPFKNRSYKEIKSVMDVNLAGTIIMTKNFMNITENSISQIRIVNLGSIYGEVAPDLSIYGDTPRMSSEIYGMTKAAIINFTKYLASAYEGGNARFNCVSPGGIEFKQGPEFKKKYAAKVPLRRMGREKEISEVICFLLSKKSSYVNGENILVDGGLTKW